jgi:hypothetical protein
MAVVNDYMCMAHGLFTNRTGMCPHGCGRAMSQLVFNKAPAFHGGRTANIDRNLALLAKDHGLSDMNNHGGDTGAFIPDRNFLKAQQDMQENMVRGLTYAAPIASGENAIPNTLTQNSFQADNALEQVKPLLQKPKINVHAAWTPKEMPKVE